MGVTKNYFKFASAGTCNVIGSNWAGLQLLPTDAVKGRKDSNQLVCVGACENVIVWDIHTEEKVKVLEGELQMVTSLKSGSGDRLAVGYQNGAVAVFTLDSGEKVMLEGHRSAVSCLAYDSDDGLTLASGSKDTDIIIWDISNEKGLYRLKGHQNEVTQIRFLAQRNILVSSSMDTFVKFWDLTTQHCFRTMTDHTASVGDFVFCKNDSLLITGSAMQDLKLWTVEFLQNNVPELPAKKTRFDKDEEDDEDEQLKLTAIGTIPKECKEAVLSTSVSTGGNLLGFHGNDKKLVIYRIHSDAEVEKRLKKRTKKKKVPTATLR